MLNFIVNILSTPAILVGLLSLVGLALQKKPYEEIEKATDAGTYDNGLGKEPDGERECTDS